MTSTTRNIRMILTGALFFLTTPLTACHVAPPQPAATAAPPTVAAVVQNPALYSGKNIHLDARFSGWQGNCRGPVPATRSDWMIEDDGACLYVTGPVPVGFSAAPPARGIGETISVSGIIELTQDGRAYLRIAP